MNKFKIPALISTLSLLLLTTLNIANADSNEDRPIPFLPPFQHSQSQLQPLERQPLHPLHMNPPPEKQSLNLKESSNGHKNQFDNHSPTVTSIMPF
jgi:hypothetical protein